MSQPLTLFMSSVAGNVAVKKQTATLQRILDTHKIAYTCVDLSLPENEHHKSDMPSRTIPQLKTSDGKFVTLEEVEDVNEGGVKELKAFLGLSA